VLVAVRTGSWLGEAAGWQSQQCSPRGMAEGRQGGVQGLLADMIWSATGSRSTVEDESVALITGLVTR